MAFCKYIFLQFCLIFCISNCRIRLFVYLSSHSITEREIKFSGGFIMSLKSKSSDVECSLWNNSFAWLRFFNSMSILITSEKYFCIVWKIRIAFPIYSIDSNRENDNQLFSSNNIQIRNFPLFIRI